MRIGSTALEHPEHDRRICDGSRERSCGVLIGCDRNNPIPAYAAYRGLNAHEHRLIRRAQDRTGCFGADVRCPEICRRPYAGARSAGCQHGAAVAHWIAARIVRIEAVSAERAVIGRHRDGNVIRQLGHDRFRDDDRTRLSQVLRERRFVWRDEPIERQRAAGRRHVDGVDVVLQRNGDAVKRPADFSLRALAIARVSLLERSRVDRDSGVQRVFVERNAREVLLHDLVRRGATVLHGRSHLRNRRLDDAEGFARVDERPECYE